MTNDEELLCSITDVKKKYGEEVYEALKNFKTVCTKNEIPMFLSLAVEDRYFTDCIFAVLDNPDYGSRIGDLLLAVRGVETKYPEHIQRAISLLEDWLDREKTYTGKGKNIPEFRKYEDVVSGQMVTSLFKEETFEDDIVEGRIKPRSE